LFFVPGDLGGESFQNDAQMFDLGGQAGEGVGFSSAGAVLFDDGS
jgi:hypothetical protein